MRTTDIATAIALTALAVFVLAACTSRDAAPDPVALQAEIAEEIAEYRAIEIDLVRSTVLDADRAERFIVLLGKSDQLINDHVQEVNAHREQIAALNADYAAERASFDVLLNNYNEQRATAQREIIALIVAMKQATTADEWQVISKYQLQKLGPRQTGNRQLQGGA